MRGEKLSPSCPFQPFGRRVEPVFFEHVGDGAPCHLVAQIGECAPDVRIAPVPVLGGCPNDQLSDVLHDVRTTWSSAGAAVVLPRDQLSMPAQECVRRDERFESTERLPPEGLGVRNQAAALGVSQPETARAELLPEDAILFLKILDDVTPLLADPPGERDTGNWTARENGDIRGERSRGPRRS